MKSRNVYSIGAVLLLLLSVFASLVFVVADDPEIPAEYAEAYQELDHLMNEISMLEGRIDRLEEAIAWWNQVIYTGKNPDTGAIINQESLILAMQLVSRYQRMIQDSLDSIADIRSTIDKLEENYPGITQMWNDANTL